MTMSLGDLAEVELALIEAHLEFAFLDQLHQLAQRLALLLMPDARGQRQQRSDRL